MYQRVGSAAYKADLKNTLLMCKLLDNPERKFKTIHVAGTNGKGSVSNMLASVMQEAGYKTGLYTSPHFIDFRERISVNGELISELWVVDFVAKWKTNLEAIDLSFFEMTVGMAFQYFAEEKVDVAIIEVGLGGRLDSTNVIKPEVSVITNIGYDHMRFLGNTLPEIAAEKAGIIKYDTPVVIGETQDETVDVFKNKSARMKAPITFADQAWKICPAADETILQISRENAENFEIDFPLKGAYQKKNLKTVLETLHALNKSSFTISREAIRKGIKNIFINTGFKGRWQVLDKNPLIICDSGHNREGIMQVVENIKATKYEKLHFVLGVVNDKSLDQILILLPNEATYYFCKADIPRGLAANELAEIAGSFGLIGKPWPSVEAAYLAARKNANPDDLVFVGGSTFVVAEVLDFACTE
jgi:dihydrofolate synthase/folylpolyglutamate synthase